MPDDIRYPVTIWELQVPQYKGQRFIGGYYPTDGGSLPIHEENGKIRFAARDPFRLGVGKGTFFGVEEEIFRQVAAISRQGLGAAAVVSRFEQIAPFYSGVSMLRDGSVLGPLEFFTPVQTTTI